MIIAINTIFFNKENEADFLKKVFHSIIASHPENTFLLITTEEAGIDSPSNVLAINPGPPPAKTNRWLFWSYFKLKQILKKYRPDVLISNGETPFHFINISQIVFNPDLSFIHDPISTSAGLRRTWKLFARNYYQKVKHVIVFSEFEKNFLKKILTMDEQKINIIHYGAPADIKTVDYDKRETIKETYAKGFEYFLYAGYVTQNAPLIILLKSFSAFKKRQRSSMQLLIMGPKGIQFDIFQKTISLYKYKDDVHIISGMEHFQSQLIISSAYALIFPNRFDNRSYLLLLGLKYGVPSLVSNQGSLREAGADAVVLFEADDIPDLSGKMMHLFKDEKFRKNLIDKGKVWIDEKKFGNGIHETWQLIEGLKANPSAGLSI